MKKFRVRLNLYFAITECLLIVLIALTPLILLYFAKSGVKGASGSINAVTRTWSAPYVFDVSWADDSTKCTGTFEDGFEYRFPGTSEFCRCSSLLSSDYTYKTISNCKTKTKG